LKTQKEIKKEYKSMKFRAGIFQIINTREKRIYLQTTLDLDRAYNSDTFQLKAGMHSNSNLQNDWNRLGAEAFAFKPLDELKVKDTATPQEINRDLKELLQMHLAEMKKEGQLLY
jgi:hypothetical protein